MRRIARILGVIGGIGAIVWAMRERLISVAISREPVPPAFRVPADEPPVPIERSASITEVAGIGPVYATRLGEIGVNSPNDLARAEASRIAEAAQVPVSRATAWIEAAEDLLERENARRTEE